MCLMRAYGSDVVCSSPAGIAATVNLQHGERIASGAIYGCVSGKTIEAILKAVVYYPIELTCRYCAVTLSACQQNIAVLL